METDEQNKINLPIFIADHPTDYLVEGNDEKEEIFYREVVDAITGNESDKDPIGEFYIWYKSDNKINMQKIPVYKNIVASGIGPGGLKHIIEYFARYYKKYKGEFIQILYIQNDTITWSYKNGEFTKTDLSQSYKYWEWV